MNKKKTKKLNFYTEFDASNNTWVGRCHEVPGLTYARPNRSTALSGIKRLVAKSSLSALKRTAAMKAPVVQALPKVNRIAFVIDRSGSMGGLTSAAVAALRTNVAEARAQAAKTGQETLVTIVAFDDVINFLRTDVPIEQLVLPGEHEFRPRNNTALLDATGDAIATLRKLSNFDAVNADPNRIVDQSFLVISITDGHENASYRYSTSGLAALIKQLQQTDRWTMTFLVPPGARQDTSNKLKVPLGNVAEWEGTVQGIQQYAVQNSAGISNYYASRRVGVNSLRGTTALNSFYSDLSGVSSKQVKTTLDDITSQVKAWEVKKEEKIREFVEGKLGQPMLKGAAFYALTKTEKKVQPNKQIVIAEKNKDKYYGGDEARGLLGLPVGQTVKVVPGNHAGFDIYVQSTSTNRALVRGTKVVYWPAVGVAYKEGPSSQAKKGTKK